MLLPDDLVPHPLGILIVPQASSGDRTLPSLSLPSPNTLLGTKFIMSQKNSWNCLPSLSVLYRPLKQLPKVLLTRLMAR